MHLSKQQRRPLLVLHLLFMNCRLLDLGGSNSSTKSSERLRCTRSCRVEAPSL